MRKFKLIVALLLLLMLIVPLKANTNREDLVLNNSIAPKESSLLSNKYTQIEDDLREASNDFISLNNYLFIGETDDLVFYLKEEDLSFRIVNKETNYMWGSSFEFDYLEEDSPLHDDGDMGANLSWQQKFSSPIIISYYQQVNLREEHLFSSSSSIFSYETIKEDKKVGFKAKLSFFLAKVDLELFVYINDEGLHIEIPFDGIVEKGDLQLSSISVYPYFGAAKRNRIPGYTFIPDGIGALIRFDDKLKETYSKRFYGPDLGLNLTTEESFLSLNTYGVVQGVNQNAFLSIIDSGASHALLTVSPSREETDFNHSYVTYTYRADYTQYLNESKTSSIKMVQTNKNNFDVKQSYYFLSNEEANYVGIANKYKQELINKRVLIKEDKGEIPLHLDILMSESKKAFLGRKQFKMTSFSYLDFMIKDLETEVSKLNISLYGWQKGGYSDTSPNYNKISNIIGKKRKLKEIVSYNHDLYLEVDLIKVNDSGKGYKKGDVSQSIGRELIKKDNNYYLKPKVSLDILNKLEKRFKGYYDGYLLSSLNVLYSDFNPYISREEQVAYLEEMININSKTAVSEPLGYMLGANTILNTQMYSSTQSKFNDTVPFLTIVLSGYKEAFARNANFFSNTANELLRMVDYQLYPSFIVTEESSYYLLNTGSENIYTSKYSSWEEEIKRQYNFINEALKHVKGASIISREVIKTGVVKNTYDNGVIIYVNYSNNDYVDENVLVNKMAYKVIL